MNANKRLVSLAFDAVFGYNAAKRFTSNFTYSMPPFWSFFKKRPALPPPPATAELAAEYDCLYRAVCQSVFDHTSAAMAEHLQAAEQHCTVIHWLHGEGRVLARFEEYRQLLDAHATFYRCAAHMLACHRDGKLLDAVSLRKTVLPQRAETLMSALHALMALAEQEAEQS